MVCFHCWLFAGNTTLFWSTILSMDNKKKTFCTNGWRLNDKPTAMRSRSMARSQCCATVSKRIGSLTTRLHYGLIYKGSIRFDLVRSSTPVYTVFTNGDETVPQLLITSTKKAWLVNISSVNMFCNVLLRQHSITIACNTNEFLVTPTDSIPKVRYRLH